MAYDRGRIAVGQAADIVIFDRDQITDRATFAEPQKPSEGVRFVLVNGEVVLEDGKFTGAKPGRVLRGPGYREDRAPCHVATGETHPKLEQFDRLMEEFVREHSVPGAALAVTERGRLVYARGFGYADFAEQRPVTPHSRFRIASVSKPITAVAILQLVEQGRLGLDDKVFDVLTGYEPHLEDSAKFDERQKQITIRQLLQHTGGWDRDESFDAMFQSVRFAKSLGVDPPAGPDHVIRCMLGVPLDFDPGERYAYSNYGYCLLGRVIEKLTGLTYEGYARQHVLAPLGITGMRIGKTHPDYAADPDEVHYYECEQGDSVFAPDLGKPVPWPYGGWYLEAMDAHGAWVASAVDLARLVVAFDDADDCPLLKPETFAQIFERPSGKVALDDEGHPRPNYYGLGFSILEVDGPQKINYWHTGSLAGTATLMVHRHDDRNFVVLFNARKSRRASHLGRAIDVRLHESIDSAADWPDHDLFQSTAPGQ
jgi:N-acyl-D-amino-acid deacylase